MPAQTTFDQKQMTALHALAKALLEYETIEGFEVDQIIRGETIKREDPAKAETGTTLKAASTRGDCPAIINR